MKGHTDIKRTRIVLFLMFLMCAASYAQLDKCESPYFVVLSDEGDVARLPLKATEVDVNISGVIADVNVKQIYTNTGKTTIEAIYVFPSSTRAAVYEMVMTIGDRKIRAKIEEKKKARSMYETAKKEGKTTSLLEEERPNVFKMNVANILPGATVEVDMSYTELLIPTAKIYEFVYPTVSGPRYVSRDKVPSNQTQTWNGNPYLEEGVEPVSNFDIQIHLNTGIPIQSIRCETHKNNINNRNETKATLSLDEPKGGNRDFVMQYKLAGDQIETGVLLYDNPEGEKFFLAMVQPPASVEPENIPAREYIFIVDVSGSMNGFPLDISKSLMRSLLGRLNESDLFNIVFFAGDSYIYAEKSLPVTQRNIDGAINFVDNTRGQGSTELLCALHAAMNMNESEDFARSFVILTDGYVTVEKETFDYIRQNLGTANFFSFGIGSSVNRYIIEGMAHVGYGEPFVALNKNEATEQAEKFEQYISQPVLTGISYSFDGFEAYDVLPKQLPDLFAERPIIISGKYKGDAKGSLEIKGLTGKSTISKSIEIRADKSENSALKYLWAREKIRLLGDYASLGQDYWSRRVENSDNIEEEVTALGLKYNLLTQYTSFVAIDSITSNDGGEQTTVTQPLPLPQGVPNSAVGNQGSLTIRGISKQTVSSPPAFAQTLTIVDDMELNEDSEIEIMDFEEEEEDGNSVFMVVERMPSFPGGDAALLSYLKNNVKYPKDAMVKGFQGRVYVEFVVDTCGAIMDVHILKGVHTLLDAEALRVVKAMPKWEAGTQRGKRVKVSYRFPINFTLGSTTSPHSKPNMYNTEGSVGKQYYKVQPCK